MYDTLATVHSSESDSDKCLHIIRIIILFARHLYKHPQPIQRNRRSWKDVVRARTEFFRSTPARKWRQGKWWSRPKLLHPKISSIAFYSFGEQISNFKIHHVKHKAAYLGKESLISTVHKMKSYLRLTHIRLCERAALRLLARVSHGGSREGSTETCKCEV